jgi:hypothetical protein
LNSSNGSVEHCHEANIFDRATLQFTVKLIRVQNPSLALRIQNIIAPGSSQRIVGDQHPQGGDLFSLDLDTFSLKRIVETLGEVGLAMAQYTLRTREGDHEVLKQTKQVMDRWLDYARQHQDTRVPEEMAGQVLA